MPTQPRKTIVESDGDEVRPMSDSGRATGHEPSKEGSHVTPISARVVRGDGVPGAEKPKTNREHKSSIFIRVLRGVLKTVLPLLILAGAFGGYVYLKQTKPSSPERVKAERVYAVDAFKVAMGTHQPTLTLYGSVVAGRQVDIRALVTGRVIATGDKLREGGVIDKDDLLVEIDPFDFEAAVAEAKAQLAEAKARKAELEASVLAENTSLEFAREQLMIAERDLERAQPLMRRGVVSKQTLDQRQNTVSQRRQQVQASVRTLEIWRARIEQQQAIIARLESSVAVANRRLDDTKLRAPFNAYITNVTTQTGRTVTANDTIATLIDRDWIEAQFVLSNEQYGRVISDSEGVIGRPVDVSWTLGGKQLVYKAKIVQVGAEVSSASGGVEVFARVDNALDPVPLRPGAFVEISLPDKNYSSVFKIPSVAVYSGNVVYVVVDGRLAPRKIEVVGSDGKDLLVSGDLKSGDEIITTRLSKPGTGVRVDISSLQRQGAK